MQGLLAIGPTLLIKHYLFGVFKQTQCPETMEHAMKILTWSFKALLAGKWPRLDWNNVPFAARRVPFVHVITYDIYFYLFII